MSLCDIIDTILIMEQKLAGDYIAGFVDGEGCFYLTYRSEKKYSRPGQPIYHRWVPYFAIVLREDDREILEKIKHTVGCGTISYTQNQVRFNVQNITDILEKIIPFFDKYKLQAKKYNDFILWKEAAQLISKNIYNNRNYSDKQHQELVNIREKMKLYKSKMHRGYKNQPYTK